MIDPGEVPQRLVEALREVRGSGTPWTALAEHEQERWRKAVQIAGVAGPFCIRAPITMDLAETSFDWARSVLGGVPASQCTIVHGPDAAQAARAIADRVGCSRVEVPPALMRHRFGWAVTSEAGCAWSEGFS